MNGIMNMIKIHNRNIIYGIIEGTYSSYMKHKRYLYPSSIILDNEKYKGIFDYMRNYIKFHWLFRRSLWSKNAVKIILLLNEIADTASKCTYDFINKEIYDDDVEIIEYITAYKLDYRAIAGMIHYRY